MTVGKLGSTSAVVVKPLSAHDIFVLFNLFYRIVHHIFILTFSGPNLCFIGVLLDFSLGLQYQIYAEA